MSAPRTFFGGSSVFDGRARKLNATTFKEVVERYINVPVQAPYTRQEFFALPEKERNRRKDSAFILACSYPFEEGKREDDTATAINMVIVDMDEGDFIKEFDQSPETLGEHLWPYAFIAWRTSSYRPEAPRLKVAVSIAPDTHPKHHRRFLKFLLDRMGVPQAFKGSRESGVLSQPQYRPPQFRGEEFTAIIASRPDGIDLHLSDLPTLDEEETELIEGRTYACDRWDDDDILGLAYLPVSGLTVEDIREPLHALDPDCDYKIWLDCCSGLRAQFLSEEDAQEAYELFDEWSAGGLKYEGRGSTFAKWRSVRPYAPGRAPITIRTIFKYALDSGKWDGGKIARKVKMTVLEWIASCEDKDTLMQEGANRIASMPFKNEVVEEELVIAWQKRIKELSGTGIDKATLRKEVNRTRKKEAAKKIEGHEDLMPGWLRPQVFLAVDDVFFDFADGVALKPGAFDRKFEKELLPREQGEIPANGKPIMSPSAYALNIMKIPRVDRKIYCPLHAGEDPFFEYQGKLFLNTYDRNSIPVEDPEFALKAGELFVAHCTHLVGPDYVDMLLDFLAWQVQHPGRKLPWAPALQSAEGVGKSLMGKIMARVLGIGNVKIVSPEIIRSQWNDWMTQAAFFVLEEIHFPGERREAIMNALKTFISDATIPINQRNMTARAEPSWSNVLAFTNFSDALHLKASDRRWWWVRSPLQTKQHVLDLNATGHFDRVEWLLTDDGASGLRYWLRKRQIAADFPVNGPAPHTKFRDAIVDESKNVLQVKIEDLIEDNEHPLISAEVIHVGRLNEVLQSMGERGKEQLVSRYLTLMGYEKYGSRRFRIDECRGALWVHTEKWLNGVPPEDFLKRRMEEIELDLV